ncbi:MAG: sigma 54-interacting transcriptional regulator [Chloracidobacterium sp.]|nr:sigma 54-interacting transcriptional regulator [Chloracidobacterium sp.]
MSTKNSAKRLVKTPDGAEPAGERGRHSLVLQAWEAINSERELEGVLAAVAKALVHAAPFFAVAVIAPEARRGAPWAMYIAPGGGDEGVDKVHQRLTRKLPPIDPTPEKKLIPYEGSELEILNKVTQPYICDDLLKKDAWFPHEFKLAAVGIRAYASIPLRARGKGIGFLVFSRIKPDQFTPEQMTILLDMSRAVAVAVANALANEEIARLRDQLEAENLALRDQLSRVTKFEEMVGDSPSLRRALEAVEQVAATDATVLITGETGTGKELVARAIHQRSHRAWGPLVKFNCAAIPETLLASELFGHERGAFTGASSRRKGRFEQAHGGTLFLDEIGELPPELQVMLLRVLQEREFERLGGSDSIRVDVRIVAATNRDLAEDVRARRFRGDLYYRLNVFPLRLPPLRERPEDIPLLAAHFAAKHGARFGRIVNRIERRSLKLLESHHWPGNVRELENVIERAIILSRDGVLRIERDALPNADLAGNIDERLRGREREAIEMALRASHGRVSGPKGAARALGLAPSTLDLRIKSLGIDKFQYRKTGG